MNHKKAVAVLFGFLIAISAIDAFGFQLRKDLPLPAAADEQERKPFIGVMMTDTEDESGVKLNEVVEKSPANIAGLLAEDVIIKFGIKEVNTVTALREELAHYEIGEQLVITVKRGGKEMKFDLELGDSITRLPVPKAKIESTSFPSADDLQVTVDLYLISKDKSTPFIVLCHQAGWSRGEYREIAPRLNRMGFNCMAIDQRSGGKVNKIQNMTSMKAIAQGKKPNFVTAEQDMVAALKWVKAKKYADGKLILWGSSYSSALAIRIAGEEPDLMDGVLAFAPGEYFERFDKPKDWIATSAKKVKVPVFITSAKNEATNWQAIFEAIPGDSKKKFIPTTKGNHGSRALWEEFADNVAYWKSVEEFLAQFK